MTKSKEINPEYALCPIRNVISKFGDKWSLLVLYHLHRNGGGVMRFSELHRQMTDCSQKMLSQTLKNLEKSELITRHVYAVVPPRVEYALTERGQSLVPILDALIVWARANFYQQVL